MRTHGWGGRPPGDDDEAIRRILAATRRAVDEHGATTSIAHVARDLSVTRQTIYRYFPTTEELLTASAFAAADDFLTRLGAHLAGLEDPVEAVVEAVAFSVEQLPHDPQLGILLTEGRLGLFTEGVTKGRALAVSIAMLRRMPVQWSDDSDDALGELAEWMLRILQSYVLDTGDRDGAELRAHLRRWLAPAIEAHQRSTVDATARTSREPAVR